MFISNEIRYSLLETIYSLSDGKITSIIKKGDVIQECTKRNICSNSNDIDSIILFLEEQGFLTAIKADNAGVLAVKITSSGINKIENTSVQENWKNISDIQKVYPAGSDYDFYRDMKQIMQSAKSSILIVDPYIDEDLFDLYVSKLLPNLDVKLLSKQPNPSFIKVIQKFSKQYGITFKCKYSTEIHDRVIIIDQFECYVIGQSIKDAAIKKSTYMTRLDSLNMVKLYDDIWNRSNEAI